MKTLILLRHAKSGWDDPVARDFDRPLNAKGMRAAEAMGRHARAIGLTFDRIVASPARRVQETMIHFGEGYGTALTPEWDRRAYLASPGTLLDLVREQPETADRVLIAGHNPGLEELVLDLVPEGADERLRVLVEQKYPTAAIAVMTLGETWAEVASGGGRLARFIRPRDVDPSLGPDRD
ncbi:histidine phosphatase family protein [Sphingomonas sp. BGYR3]|uniref:SixA phosphatase family protein n=1 Tax=Sphingomonas sp. BGYR3 TaxID=2975483 RepID=UPI0021A4C1ED|nr:histidine phosphatase family protein [Sphingomonas sp. BGYR3]MDG5488688.1 histidine phosphatase family protein [Sphingomonas sp. BGYR3]